MNTSIKRHTARTGIYYVAVIAALIIFMTSGEFRSGPCTPNLDVVFPFLAGPVSFGLLIYNLVLVFSKSRKYIYSMLMHLSAVTTWIIMMMITL